MLQLLFAFALVCQIKESFIDGSTTKDSVTQAGCSRHSQTVPICWGIPKYRDASQILGTVALSCSKSLWLFYLFCQLFLKPIKHDKFLFKELFLLQVQEGGDVLVHHQVEVCSSDYSFYFLVVIYSINGMLLAFGTFLAWETKKVTIPALNDSQNIGICIYNVVVLSLLGVTLSLVLTTQTTLSYVLTSALLIIGTTITQLVMFVPKVNLLCVFFHLLPFAYYF